MTKMTHAEGMLGVLSILGILFLSLWAYERHHQPTAIQLDGPPQIVRF